MALRGKKPEQVVKRFKAFFYGAAGVGKTMAAIQFPAPYVIDTERGAENAQYIDLISKGGGAIFQASDFSEILSEVKALLTEKHDYKTLVIDPLTTVYNSLLDQSAQKLSKFDSNGGVVKDGTEMGRHYGEANKRMKGLLNLLLRLDMNVIITSHAKEKYGDKMAVIGETFDCYKKMDYLFDLMLEIQKNGKSHMARVKKTRISSFEEGEVFPFSYTEVADRYGRDIIEMESVPQQLATQEQVNEINYLIQALKVGDDTVSKWLAKSNSEKLEDMDSAIIQLCINSLRAKFDKMEDKKVA